MAESSNCVGLHDILTTKPTQEGVYEVELKDSDLPMYARWQDGEWKMVCSSIEAAKRESLRSEMCYDGTVRHFGVMKEAA